MVGHSHGGQATFSSVILSGQPLLKLTVFTTREDEGWHHIWQHAQHFPAHLELCTGYSSHISNPVSLPLPSPPLLQPIYIMKLSASAHLALAFTTFLSAFLVLCLPKQQQRYRFVETRSCCIACPVLNLLNSVLLCPPKCSC